MKLTCMTNGSLLSTPPSRVQQYSAENRMTAQNLALVFVPTLFQELAMNTDMVQLTRELIIHYTLLFLVRHFELHLFYWVIKQ